MTAPPMSREQLPEVPSAKDKMEHNSPPLDHSHRTLDHSHCTLDHSHCTLDHSHRTLDHSHCTLDHSHCTSTQHQPPTTLALTRHKVTREFNLLSTVRG